MRPGFIDQRGVAMGMLVLSIAFAAMGIVFVNLAQQSAARSEFVKTWSETEGTLTRADLSGQDSSSLDVQYRYRVAETPFENNKLLLDDNAVELLEKTPKGVRVRIPGKKSEPLAAELVTGEKVTVWYNPHNPHESVLYPYYAKDMKGFMLGGILLVLTGMLFAVRALAED